MTGKIIFCHKNHSQVASMAQNSTYLTEIIALPAKITLSRRSQICYVEKLTAFPGKMARKSRAQRIKLSALAKGVYYFMEVLQGRIYRKDLQRISRRSN